MKKQDRKWITEQVIIRNAEILYPNFDGHETDYNEAGERNFCVIIPDKETALAMREDLWNIKELSPADEGGEPRYYMAVNLSWRGHTPPSVWMKMGKKTTLLTEQTVSLLQGKKFESVNLIINPSNWPKNWDPEIGGRHGVKGYVDTMYVTLQSDPFYEEFFGVDGEEDDDIPFDLE